MTALTREFLCTVYYHSGSAEQDHPEPYIGFYLRGARYTLTMTDLRLLFHLPVQPDRDSYSFPISPHELPITTLPEFWAQISHVPYTDDRVAQISHPVIRFIFRTLSATVYCRGEIWIRPLDQEIQLLYHILSPEAQVHDLAYYMVEYWEGLQRGRRNTGGLHAGSYVSRIATHLGVPLGNDVVTEVVCDYEAIKRSHWIVRRASPTLLPGG